MSNLWQRLKLSRTIRKDLDQVLANAPGPETTLRERTSWFFDLLEWIRHRGHVQQLAEFKSGTPQSIRVRHILNVLDRNETWKLKVAASLRSVFQETSALNLFEQTGLSLQDSLTAEFIDRLQKKILPVTPDEKDLSYLFQHNFHSETDLQWVQQIDSATFVRIQELLKYGDSGQSRNSLSEDAQKAILLLSVQVQALGLSHQLRQRLTDPDFRKNSFYLFSQYLQKYFSETDSDLKAVLGSQFNKKLEVCLKDLSEIKQHLNEFGVSVQIVFQIDKLESLLRRIQNLFLISEQKEIDPLLLSQFLESLIAESLDKNHVRSLLSESFSLLARKIIERTAETGEHYITRNFAQQKVMLAQAAGGGLVTTFTCLLKLFLTSIGLSPFFLGLASTLNYSLSFLTIHFLNFTLATKQSSMTAPALAAKMQNLESPESFDNMISEIINLLRTQVTAVFGNILGVVPLTLVIGWSYLFLFGQPIMSQETAMYTLNSFSFFGPTPLFAAFTGVLLWLSSLAAGWIDNWFAYHRLSSAISQNRRLCFVLGESRARWVAQFLRSNLAAIAGSISLGFLLGLAPALLQFFGILLDVRHVTLSSGAMAAALISLDVTTVSAYVVVTAALGILTMAILNLSVSFTLAFIVAVRARRIQSVQRQTIYRAVLRKLVKNPTILFFPAKDQNTAKS